MKKQAIIEQIKERLGRDIHDEMVSYYVNKIYTNLVTKAFIYEGDSIDSCVKEYKGLDILEYPDGSGYFTDLPADLLVMDKVHNSIRWVDFVDSDYKASAMSYFEQRMKSHLSISSTNTVGYTYKRYVYSGSGSLSISLDEYGIIEYKTDKSLSGKVDVGLLIPFYEFGYDEYVSLPNSIGGMRVLIDETVNFIGGKPTDDKTINNQENRQIREE